VGSSWRSRNTQHASMTLVTCNSICYICKKEMRTGTEHLISIWKAQFEFTYFVVLVPQYSVTKLSQGHFSWRRDPQEIVEHVSDNWSSVWSEPLSISDMVYNPRVSVCSVRMHICILLGWRLQQSKNGLNKSSSMCLIQQRLQQVTCHVLEV
jgi:hypothetical protein